MVTPYSQDGQSVPEVSPCSQFGQKQFSFPSTQPDTRTVLFFQFFRADSVDRKLSRAFLRSQVGRSVFAVFLVVNMNRNPSHIPSVQSGQVKSVSPVPPRSQCGQLRPVSDRRYVVS